MADVPLSDFLRSVLPAVDGCPRNTALLELRNTVIDFCSRAWADQRVVQGTIDSGDQLLVLTPPEGFAVVSVIALSVDGRPGPLVPMTRFQMDAYVPAWQNDAGVMPSHFVHQTVTELLLWPALAADAEALSYSAVLAVKPDRNGNEVAGDIYQDYYEVIVAGALARLLRMPGKSWTDLKQAGISSEQYMRGMNEAKVRVINQYSNANTFVQRPTFGVS